MKMTTPVIKKAAIPAELRDGGTVYGTVDPRTGDLVFYPLEITRAIRAGVATRAEAVQLANFHGATVYLRSERGLLQQTNASGQRSVFRAPADTLGGPEIEREVFNSKDGGQWQLMVPECAPANPGVTRIAFVVDTSGSMRGCYDTVVKEAFDGFLDTQRLTLETELRFVGITFSDAPCVRFDGADLRARLDDIERDFLSVEPTGSTAFYDAFMKAIEKISALTEADADTDTETEAETDDEVIVVLLTDGEDNGSRVDPAELKTLVNDRRSRLGWKFVLLSAGDVISDEDAAAMGITTDELLAIGTGRTHIKRAFGALSNGFSRARVDGRMMSAPGSGAPSSVRFTPAERLSVR